MTFGFTASFATARVWRLALAQAIVALLAGLTVAQTLRHVWLPVCEDAMRQLPEGGALRDGRLIWPTNSPVRLAENSFLTVDVDTDKTGSFSHLADLGIELGSHSLKFYSLFGFLELPYPSDANIVLTRASVEPWWGARKPFVLIGVGAAIALGVFASWLALAVPYAIAVRVLTFYLDRAVTLWGAWKLAAAALLPAAFVMTAAIGLYALQRLPLAGLLLMMPLHLVVGWIYIFVTPAWLPKISEVRAAGKNPFAESPRKEAAAPHPDSKANSAK